MSLSPFPSALLKMSVHHLFHCHQCQIPPPPRAVGRVCGIHQHTFPAFCPPFLLPRIRRHRTRPSNHYNRSCLHNGQTNRCRRCPKYQHPLRPLTISLQSRTLSLVLPLSPHGISQLRPRHHLSCNLAFLDYLLPKFSQHFLGLIITSSLTRHPKMQPQPTHLVIALLFHFCTRQRQIPDGSLQTRCLVYQFQTHPACLPCHPRILYQKTKDQTTKLTQITGLYCLPSLHIQSQT